jgi:hypothetical protein
MWAALALMPSFCLRHLSPFQRRNWVLLVRSEIPVIGMVRILLNLPMLGFGSIVYILHVFLSLPDEFRSLDLLSSPISPKSF